MKLTVWLRYVGNMLIPETRTGSRTNLDASKRSAAQIAARNNVIFKLRPKIAARNRERESEWVICV